MYSVTSRRPQKHTSKATDHCVSPPNTGSAHVAPLGCSDSHHFWTITSKLLLASKYGHNCDHGDRQSWVQYTGLCGEEWDADFDLRLSLQEVGWLSFWTRLFQSLGLRIHDNVTDKGIDASHLAGCGCPWHLPTVSPLSNAVIVNMTGIASSKSPHIGTATDGQHCDHSYPAAALSALERRASRQAHCLQQCKAVKTVFVAHAMACACVCLLDVHSQPVLLCSIILHRTFAEVVAIAPSHIAYCCGAQHPNHACARGHAAM